MRRKLFDLALGWLFLVALTCEAQRQPATRFVLPLETAKLKPGPGSELVTAQCLVCHSADYISTQPRLTQAQWTAIVLKMAQKYGAPVTTNRVEEISAYLTASYGKSASGGK